MIKTIKHRFYPTKDQEKNILAAGQVVFVCGGGVRLKDAKASNAVADETENLNREVRRTQ